MNEATQNKLIISSLALAALALFWAVLRNSPAGGAIRYLESGAWVPSVGQFVAPDILAGDVIIQPNNFAPWSSQMPGALDSPGQPGVSEKCGCNAFICKPDENSFATYTSGILNAALFSAPFSNNTYLGY